jgi:hypothetical protein
VEELEIQYSPAGIILLPIIAFVAGLLGPIILIIMCIEAFQRGKGILVLIFMLMPIFFFLVFLPQFIRLTKSFILFTKKKPALLLTPEQFIDNYENIKVSWKSISKVYINRINNDFLYITVTDNSMVYGQAKNKIWKFILWNNTWSGGIISINMFLLKGNNNEILNTIKDYQQKAINFKPR